MPAGRPTHRDVHVDAVLTNLSEAFIQDQTAFIADKVFPRVPVQKQTDIYYKYKRGEFWRDEAQLRAPATESAGVGYTLETATYRCEKYALHHDIPEEVRANADNPLKPDQDATELLTTKMLIKREVLWVNEFFKTGVWTSDLDGAAASPGANQFLQFDQTGSDPIGVIDQYKEAIAERTGFMPNKLVIGPKVLRVLKNHADIIDRVKYTQTGVITEDMLAGLFGVDEVLVPRAVYNTAAEGATDAFSFIHGKHMLLVYAAPNPGLKQPSGGYTFTWNGLLGSNSYAGRIKNWWMDEIEADRIEIEMALDMKLTAADLGAFFENAIA